MNSSYPTYIPLTSQYQLMCEGYHLTDLQEEVIKTVLHKMFRVNTFFSICDIDKLMVMLGQQYNKGPDYQTLRALHCVNWGDMSRELREATFQATLNVLNITIVINENNNVLRTKILPATTSDTPSFFKRLFSKSSG